MSKLTKVLPLCSRVRAAVLLPDTEGLWDQITMASPDQQAEHAAREVKTWQLSVETRKPTGSCAADHEYRSLPLISQQSWTHRWTGTGADRTLWRSQSSVTDKAIMGLLCAFKAIIKCDRVALMLLSLRGDEVCIDGTLWWGSWWLWHPQNYCIFISAAKKGIWQPAPKLHQTNYAAACRPNLATFCDTWHILALECLHSPGEAGRKKFFHVENLQAAGQSNGNRCNIHAFYLPNKISFRR